MNEKLSNFKYIYKDSEEFATIDITTGYIFKKTKTVLISNVGQCMWFHMDTGEWVDDRALSATMRVANAEAKAPSYQQSPGQQ